MGGVGYERRKFGDVLVVVVLCSGLDRVRSRRRLRVGPVGESWPDLRRAMSAVSIHRGQQRAGAAAPTVGTPGRLADADHREGGLAFDGGVDGSTRRRPRRDLRQLVVDRCRRRREDRLFVCGWLLVGGWF